MAKRSKGETARTMPNASEEELNDGSISLESDSVPISVRVFANNLINNSDGILSKVQPPTKKLIGRDDEVADVIQTMYKKRSKNCILVGPAGIGKTEIARKAMMKMQNDYYFLNMDMTTLQSGCTLVGMLEKRLLTIIKSVSAYNSVSKNKKLCLFVDEMHTLWTVGKNEHSGSVSVANTLKPYLSDGTLIMLGATTKDEYDKYVKSDMAMLRRISPVFIKELGLDKTEKIIRDFCDGEISDELVSLCVKKSEEISHLQNPDCSLEIADRVMARALYYGRIANANDVEYVVDKMKGETDV